MKLILAACVTLVLSGVFVIGVAAGMLIAQDARESAPGQERQYQLEDLPPWSKEGHA